MSHWVTFAETPGVEFKISIMPFNKDLEDAIKESSGERVRDIFGDVLGRMGRTIGRHVADAIAASSASALDPGCRIGIGRSY